MENKNSSENLPPDADRPKLRPRIRRADAEPTFERIADKDTEQVITHLRPVKPAGSGISPLGLVVPIGVTLAIAAAGYFGFVHVNEQKTRINRAEIEATDAEAAREQLRRTLAETKTAIRDTRARIPLELEKARREAEYKAEVEFRDELAALSRSIAETNSAARLAAQKVDADMKRKISEIKPKLAELRTKAADLETKNREMKAWLNAHTLTMHPKF